MLPIVRNGPPGTFVAFRDGFRVSLPTDQIVAADDSKGFVSVAFGGMEFVDVEDGHLVCVRVREMLPDESLSPDRSHRMQLDPAWVTRVLAYGQQAWPETGAPA